MNDERKLNVDDAYAIETPEDSINLYRQWADSYDTDFVARVGYVAYIRVAEVLSERRGAINGPVLDIGCGTGIVGEQLQERGIREIDGVDISPEMLAIAGKKRTKDNVPVYRSLVVADLTQPLDMDDNLYAGLISAGTFTHGHLGPEPLDELWRVLAPGAQCAIGIRSTHYESMGFADKFAADVSKRIITKPEIIEVRMYLDDTDNPEHANDTANIVVCEIL